MTSAADLLALNLHYLAQEPAQQVIATTDVAASVKFVPPVVVESGVRIGPDCTIGPRVYLERDVLVGDHAQLSDTMALAGASIPSGATVAGRLVAPDLPINA